MGNPAVQKKVDGLRRVARSPDIQTLKDWVATLRERKRRSPDGEAHSSVKPDEKCPGDGHSLRDRSRQPPVVPSSHDRGPPPRQRRDSGAYVGQPPSACTPTARPGTRESLHRVASGEGPARRRSFERTGGRDLGG